MTYTCMMCETVYDDALEAVPFTELPDDWTCPVCQSPKSLFQSDSPAGAPAGPAPGTPAGTSDNPLAWPASLTKYDGGIMDEIHSMAETGRSSTEPMDTKRPVPNFDQVLLLGAQLDPMPLADDAPVNLRTVIGKRAKQPLVLETPITVSHMSFGALSAEAKVALAKGASAVGTATSSGEGGILPEERAAATRYIFEYVPNQYCVTDDNLQAADAIEIKIGQGTKPGMGGHLPGSKVTPEIAAIRKKPMGQDIQSPSCFPDVRNSDDLKELIDELRVRSGGRPIGVKVAAGHIERDLAVIIAAGADFVTIDGRGGSTGSSPKFLKDHTTMPTIYALNRAVRFIKSQGAEIDLIITGGFRTSGDIMKALAMGADAVALASAAMMACACQQYRACHLGTCPMGITTQDPELRSRLLVDKGGERVANFLTALTNELRSFCRCMGHERISDASMSDLITTSLEIASFTDINKA